METLKIIFQVLSAIMVVLAILQKDKWKMMLYYAFSSVFFVAMYFSFGRIASACISIVTLVKNLIYMFYARKKIKPNLVWLIVFEVAFIVTTALTWQDALDLMPLFAVLIAGYGSWQDNQFVLRLSYIANKGLFFIYTIIIGAYITMVVEGVNLTLTIISFIYYAIYKKEKPILQIIFRKNANKKENIAINEEKYYEIREKS